MSKAGLYSPVARRIITIITLLGIIGSFIAVYYFVYVPQERTRYNLQNFRILHEISSNLKDRIENYGAVYFGQSKQHIDPRVTAHDINDSTGFNHHFLDFFTGDTTSSDAYKSEAIIFHNHVQYKIFLSGKKQDEVVIQLQSLDELLKPVLAPHLASFESFLLLKQSLAKKGTPGSGAGYDSILYQTSNSYIANVSTDSFFTDKNIQAPVVANLTVEDIPYKMFLFPFQLNCGSGDSCNTYILAGVIPEKTYKSESQDVPVNLLTSLCLILIVLLLALPFLKVFFLSSEETISMRDIRAIILVVYVIPVFIIFLYSLVWMFTYTKTLSVNTLRSLQDSVEHNFYKEINQALLQLHDYDDAIMNARNHLDTNALSRLQLNHNSHADLKDIVFYPKKYKGFTSLHWMDNNGVDIAAWNWNTLKQATYLNVRNRQYFMDIAEGRTVVLPQDVTGSDTTHFSIQPVLSRLTGEYTINIATHSAAHIFKKNRSDTSDASEIGLSGKMYSLWNTVVPKGFAFCLVDAGGQIMAHSDTARSLQENIFEESADSLLLRSIINHKDSIRLDEVNLYDESVRMMIKPLSGLPYYLITYTNKRGEYLFMLHILAFVFLCMSALFIMVSLLSYFITISNKKLSALSYTNDYHDWLKPTPDKAYSYLKIILQSVFLASVVWLCSEAFSNDGYVFFSVNMAMVLPLFSVTGYYLVKKSRDDFGADDKTGKPRFVRIKSFTIGFIVPGWRSYLKFFTASAYTLLLYVLSSTLFLLLQSALLTRSACNYQVNVNPIVYTLLILVPLGMFLLAGVRVLQFGRSPEQTQAAGTSRRYLFLFVVALLFSVLLTGIIPAITFLSYAFREEKTLQTETFQIDLARKIQQRRLSKNSLPYLKKPAAFVFKNSTDSFLHQSKFSEEKGIYLLDNDTLVSIRDFNAEEASITSCSPFYKKITEYLFLPPDHDEFYDNLSHKNFYYWQSSRNMNGNDSLRLSYRNFSDSKDSSSIRLISTPRHAVLFDGFFRNPLGWLMGLLLVVFILLFYNLLLSTVKRVFLIGFFRLEKETKGDAEWLKESYGYSDLGTMTHPVITGKHPVSMASIRSKENEEADETMSREERIIYLQISLAPVYEIIWNKLTDMEKFTLYDFATDGFTNYKRFFTLYDLRKKGLLVMDKNGNLTMMTKSFRNFLITKERSPEVHRLSNEGKKGSWGTLRTVFYVVLLALVIFIFLSQEEASKQLITIITSLGALLPAILKLFDKSTFTPPAAEGGKK